MLNKLRSWSVIIITSLCLFFVLSLNSITVSQICIGIIFRETMNMTIEEIQESVKVQTLSQKKKKESVRA